MILNTYLLTCLRLWRTKWVKSLFPVFKCNGGPLILYDQCVNFLMNEFETGHRDPSVIYWWIYKIFGHCINLTVNYFLKQTNQIYLLNIRLALTGLLYLNISAPVIDF